MMAMVVPHRRNKGLRPNLQILALLNIPSPSHEGSICRPLKAALSTTLTLYLLHQHTCTSHVTLQSRKTYLSTVKMAPKVATMLTAFVMRDDISDARTPMPMTWKIWGANCTSRRVSLQDLTAGLSMCLACSAQEESVQYDQGTIASITFQPYGVSSHTASCKV